MSYQSLERPAWVDEPEVRPSESFVDVAELEMSQETVAYPQYGEGYSLTIIQGRAAETNKLLHEELEVVGNQGFSAQRSGRRWHPVTGIKIYQYNKVNWNPEVLEASGAKMHDTTPWDATNLRAAVMSHTNKTYDELTGEKTEHAHSTYHQNNMLASYVNRYYHPLTGIKLRHVIRLRDETGQSLTDSDKRYHAITGELIK